MTALKTIIKLVWWTYPQLTKLPSGELLFEKMKSGLGKDSSAVLIESRCRKLTVLPCDRNAGERW
jgi:hypothetical protein